MNDFGDKISIVVPAYNIAGYLPRCLDSILDQTYKNIEVIVVNDGSKDNTEEVIREYCQKDSRIKLISKINEGVTKARLTGMKAATGQWIGFVDGDDFVESEMYETLLFNALKYNADISHCGYQMVFPSRVDYYYNTGKLVEQDNDAGVKDLLEGVFIEPGLCNKIYKKSLCDDFLQEDKMDLSIKNNEDLLMNFYLFSASKKAVYFDKCFYHYILRKGSASTSVVNENKLKDPLKVLKIIKSNCYQNKGWLLIVNARISANLIANATGSATANPELIKPYKKNARKELRKMMPEFIKGDYSFKRKLVTVWVAIWPWSYGAVHYAYAKLTGVDKKYEVK